MNDFLTFFIAITGLSLLCAGWIALQFLARKMKTKNHFDNLNSSCGNCTCGGEGECTREH